MDASGSEDGGPSATHAAAAAAAAAAEAAAAGTAAAPAGSASGGGGNWAARWAGLPTAGTVVEYPLPAVVQAELQDGRSHGVGLLVGRNCDRCERWLQRGCCEQRRGDGVGCRLTKACPPVLCCCVLQHRPG